MIITHTKIQWGLCHPNNLCITTSSEYIFYFGSRKSNWNLFLSKLRNKCISKKVIAVANQGECGGSAFAMKNIQKVVHFTKHIKSFK